MTCCGSSALSDIADVDKIEYPSSPPTHVTNPKAPGATNPLIIHAYTFIPKNLDRSKKQPLITFAHQGVHANFDTSDLHVMRELLEQGYSIIALRLPRQHRLWPRLLRAHRLRRRAKSTMSTTALYGCCRTYSFLDPNRVGMMGWSHGGCITLMNIMEHPEDLRCRLCGRSRQRSGRAHGL